MVIAQNNLIPTLLLWCALVASATAAVGADAAAGANTSASKGTGTTVDGEKPIAIGPLFSRYTTATTHALREEALGPLWYRERERDGEASIWALPPLFSHSRNTGTDSEEMDFLYPVMTYDRYGTESRYQLFQLFSFAGGNNQADQHSKRFTLFPFFFLQRSEKPEENYTALFPFYGTVRNRMLRDEIHAVMFPFYSKTRKKDVVTENYLFPIVHRREGPGLHGWQVWPIVGHEHKEVTTKTNLFAEVEMVPGHDKWFGAWPFFLRTKSGIGSENPQSAFAVLPFYSRVESTQRETTTWLWPFFNHTIDREKKYEEWDLPWPLIVFARGEGKTANRVWPFFSHVENPVAESAFYLWPLYKYNRFHSDPVDRERTRILLFLYSDTREKNTETGEYRGRKDLWPLYTFRHDLNGNERLQILAPLEPILPASKSIERNYSPLWSLWRQEKNARTGETSQSLLWNLYRRETNPEGKKLSLLFGLVRYESTPDAKSWHWFHLTGDRHSKTAAALRPD